MNNQLWGAVVVIVLGYVLGFYFQSRSIAHLDKRIDDLSPRLDGRIDDPNSSVHHRFHDLKDWIRSEVKRLEDRIDRIKHPVVKGQDTVELFESLKKDWKSRPSADGLKNGRCATKCIYQSTPRRRATSRAGMDFLVLSGRCVVPL